MPTPREERDALLVECERLLDLTESEARSFTPDEAIAYDEKIQRIRALNLQLASAQQPTFSDDRVAQPSSTLDDTPADQLGTPRPRSLPTFHPGAKLRAFANTRDGQAQAYRSAQWVRAALLGDPKAITWCERNGMRVDIRAAHSAGENAKGGVLVIEEFSAAIIRLVDEYGVFRRNSRVVPMSSDTLNIPRRAGGLTAHYVGENAEGTESDTGWDNVQLVAKKLMILTRMSSEIADDALISMADMLAIEAALAFALKEDTVGFNGTGSAGDGGIVGVLVKALDAEHTMAKVAAATGHNLLTEIDADDLLALMAMVPKYAKKGAAWYCSPAAQEVVFNAIKIAGGGNTRDLLADSDTPRFLGYPIETTEVMADNPTTDYTNAVMVGFGNLGQASTLGSRREIRFATTDSRYWEQDQIGVRATMRHDINVHDLGSTTAKSPFAVLVGS